MPTNSDDRHELTVWAAFVLGHHPGFLENWTRNLWNIRPKIEEGSVRLEEPVPPEEYAQLGESLEILLPVLSVNRSLALKLGSWVSEANEDCWAMFRDLSHPWEGQEFDWSDPTFPSVSESLRQISLTVRRSLKDHPHILKWFELGDLLGCAYGMSPELFEQEGVCEKLTALQREGGYAFIEPICQALKGDDSSGLLSAARHLHVEPIVHKPRLSRFAAYLQQYLRQGARPIPLVVLKKDTVEFFGKEFRETDFHEAEWRILRFLCKNPRQDVPRADIKRRARLDCSPQNVAPHVTRLRKKLWPMVEEYYRGKDLPRYAKDSFIVGLKTGTHGPYRLELDPLFVRVELPPIDAPHLFPAKGSPNARRQ